MHSLYGTLVYFFEYELVSDTTLIRVRGVMFSVITGSNFDERTIGVTTRQVAAIRPVLNGSLE